jgi:predicted DNA-binding protein (MmcQ/YjbR family)
VTQEEIEAFALGLPATTKIIQWGGSDVFKVGGKVFAICGEGTISFKVSDIGFLALTEGGPGRQAPYCAKGQWANVELDALPASELQNWLKTAHELIAAKLTRKARAELGLV